MNRTLRTALATAAVALAAFGLTACGASNDATDSSPVGVWGTPDAPGEPSLTFSDDGSFSGTDGCNRLAGEWTAEGSTIDLGEMITTLMACEDVDTWLSNAATAEVSSSKLTVLDRSGTEIGELARN